MCRVRASRVRAATHRYCFNNICVCRVRASRVRAATHIYCLLVSTVIVLILRVVVVENNFCVYLKKIQDSVCLSIFPQSNRDMLRVVILCQCSLDGYLE